MSGYMMWAVIGFPLYAYLIVRLATAAYFHSKVNFEKERR